MSIIKKILFCWRGSDQPDAARLAFRCNVCGRPATVRVASLDREVPSCSCCGSTVRARALVHLLSHNLFGESLAIRDFPERRDISVLDMSGWDGYGSRLKSKLNYLNTFFHQEPRLDIMHIDPTWKGRFDVIISSDVFEHVVPPVSEAFVNVKRLLKPGGTLILTVPYTKEPTTREHFPDLHRYEILTQNGHYLLKNITRTGAEQWFDELVFHGGPGTTLEMRVFSETALRRELESADFHEILFHGEPTYDCGIVWHHNWSLPITAQA